MSMKSEPRGVADARERSPVGYLIDACGAAAHFLEGRCALDCTRDEAQANVVGDPVPCFVT